MNRPLRFTPELIEEYFAKGYWTEETTSSLWDRNAATIPEKGAFVSGSKRLTWSQAKRMSDSLARGFLELGLKKGEILLHLVPNGWQSYVARVACEKAGIVCATALMTLRESEIEYILRTFRAAAVAIPVMFRNFDYYGMIGEMRERLPRLKHIFVTGNDSPAGTHPLEDMMTRPWHEQPGTFAVNAIGATEISVIACTSGTTGLPKGVEHAQCARIAAARNYGRMVGLTGGDVVLNIASGIAGLGAAFCYNGSAALVGAKTVVVEAWSVEDTLRLIDQEKASVLVGVPAQLVQIAKSPDLGRYNLSSLRCMTTGTAPLTFSMATEVEETLKIPVVNTYGQLDGGVVTHTSIEDPPKIRRGTVGKPVGGMVVKLIDEEGREAPEGEVIYSGPATNGGYYRDSEATVKAWGSLGLSGWFKSGDLGRFDERGYLVLVGRKKEVIIRGGQNIYPSEIEGLLLTHPKIKSSALIAMPDPIMGEKACAYVALNPGERLTFEEVLTFLKGKKIAPYKLPERLEILDELPLRGPQKVAKGELEKDLLKKLEAEGKH